MTWNKKRKNFSTSCAARLSLVTNQSGPLARLKMPGQTNFPYVEH